MSEVLRWSTDSGSESETVRLGEVIGRNTEPGAVIALHGDLGAGKTRLAKGIAKGLGVPEKDRVSSPTFALIHEHEGRTPLYHMDFYRLSEGFDDPELGLDDYLWGDGICVIEWADRIEKRLPDDRLDVRMAIRGEQSRKIDFSATGNNHIRLLNRLIMSYNGR